MTVCPSREPPRVPAGTVSGRGAQSQASRQHADGEKARKQSLHSTIGQVPGGSGGRMVDVAEKQRSGCRMCGLLRAGKGPIGALGPMKRQEPRPGAPAGPMLDTRVSPRP
jgi:hypothetical protein